MLDTIEKPIAEIVTRPAKMWRNWWRTTKKAWVRTAAGEQILDAGEAFGARHIWPSKDVAEQKASEWIGAPTNWGPYEYLGAFPVSE